MSSARAVPPVDGRDVIEGDSLFFQHPEHGVLSGRVSAVGKDGARVLHKTAPDGHHKVLWQDILGVKERKARRLAIIERGEDGAIAKDESGKTVFIHGDVLGDDEPDRDEGGDEALQKAHTPVLVDLGALCGPACNHALEGLHKAISNEDGIAFDIWSAVENPFIRDLVEKFTTRGLAKLASVQAELLKWLTGEYYAPAKHPPVVPAGFAGRWSAAELSLTRLYLENIPPEAMTLDDWGLAIEYVLQRYLPLDQLVEEGEWLATKANLLGKAEAHLAKPLTPALAAAIATEMPGTVEGVYSMFEFGRAERAIIEYGRESCCDAVTALSERARHALRRVILDHQRKVLAGEPIPEGSLQQVLFDQFDALNRDWRRIAVTEAGEMANQGMIASLPEGSQVRRLEMYHGACQFCRKIDGLIFTVVDPSKPDKDGYTEVWAGKTNIGRSASPRKVVDGQLVMRDPEERWWVAAGVQHPHCRGRWAPVAAPKPDDDPEFAKWLRGHLGQREGFTLDDQDRPL